MKWRTSKGHYLRRRVEAARRSHGRRPQHPLWLAAEWERCDREQLLRGMLGALRRVSCRRIARRVRSDRRRALDLMTPLAVHRRRNHTLPPPPHTAQAVVRVHLVRSVVLCRLTVPSSLPTTAVGRIVGVHLVRAIVVVPQGSSSPPTWRRRVLRAGLAAPVRARSCPRGSCARRAAPGGGRCRCSASAPR